MKQLLMERNRRRAFFFPLILYFIFIWIFVVERFFISSFLTGNPSPFTQNLTRRYNLDLFETIARDFNPNRNRFGLGFIFMNFFLFAPLGVYVHALRKKKDISTTIEISFFIILLVESLQYILATGSFDVDDIFLNTIGMALGVCAYHLLYLFFKKDSKLANASLGAMSIPIAPLLFGLIIGLVFATSWDIAGPFILIYCISTHLSLVKLFRYEPKNIKRIYGVSALLFSFLFFLVFLLALAPRPLR